MSSTLFQLTEDYNRLLDLASSGDIEDHQAFLDTLEGLTGEIGIKADSYYAVMKRLEARRGLLEKESKACAGAAKSIKGNIARMEQALMGAMEAMGTGEVDTGLHKFKIVNNGGKPPLDIFGTVPEEYQKKEIVIKDDGDKIRAALDRGEELGFARYKERGKHLRVR